MIILGDKLVPHENIEFINKISDIKDTKPNCILLFYYNEEILKYTFDNNLKTAIIITSIKEAIYSNSLNARYIISKKYLSKNIQKIADNYMFDSKNLAIINSNDEFEEVAQNEIDGIIYSKMIPSI